MPDIPVSRCWPRSLSRVALVSSIGGALLTASCVPITSETINYVRAVGWTPDGVAVGLAQKIKVGRTFYLMSPEGRGTFGHVQALGAFVLLRGSQEVPVDVRLQSQDVQIVRAFARPSREEFVLFARRGSEKASCFIIAMDGRVSPCDPAAGEVDPHNVYVAPRSGEVRFRSGGLKPDATFKAVDLRTGQSSLIKDVFLTLGLPGVHATSAPCDTSIASLSRGEDVWAVACDLVRDSVWRAGIWLIRAGAEPFLLYELSAADLHFLAPTLEDRSRPFNENYGLAWSPDERHVYWCGGRDEGVILSISDSPPQVVSRCLKLATWSPDGTRIAGVGGRQLAELRVR